MRLAGGIGKRAAGGDLFCLYGPLGSGKTTFVRGFLRGLGFKGLVPSPTFALVNEYRSVRPRVHHLDLYRLEEGEMSGFGLEEYLGDKGAVCLIEWPEAAREWLGPDRVEISFAHARGGGRTLGLRGLGPRSRALIRRGRK